MKSESVLLFVAWLLGACSLGIGLKMSEIIGKTVYIPISDIIDCLILIVLGAVTIILVFYQLYKTHSGDLVEP